MNDPIERLRSALADERYAARVAGGGYRRDHPIYRSWATTDAALDALAAAITPPVEVESLARRSDPVTFGQLERILLGAGERANTGEDRQIYLILDALREETR